MMQSVAARSVPALGTGSLVRGLRVGGLQQQPAFVSRRWVARASQDEEAEAPTTSEQPAPTPSKPAQQEEEPVWVRREREREMMKNEAFDLPFGAYLLFSAIVAIAAVGSIFEWTSKNPIFDVIEADSPLYTPILGFFALTGLPMSGFLFFKAVSSANKAAERMDKLDGY